LHRFDRTAVGDFDPRASLRIVDLPQPDGPMSAVKDGRATQRHLVQRFELAAASRLECLRDAIEVMPAASGTR